MKVIKKILGFFKPKPKTRQIPDGCTCNGRGECGACAWAVRNFQKYMDGIDTTE